MVTESVRQSDANALIGSWYEQFGRELLVFCKGQMGHDDGQEAFQTMWHKVLKNIEKFDGSNARAWLYRIARNTIYDARKKKKPELNNLAAETKVDRAASLLDHFLDSEMKQQFQDCVERLTPVKQSLLKMRILGDSYNAIATALDIPSGTVGSRFSRVKDEVKSCVEEKS